MIALPALAAVLAALLALLLMYGVRSLIKCIAQIFPGSIGVGVVSIHPRSWVEDAANAVTAGITWLLGDVIRPVINFVLGPAIKILSFIESLADLSSEIVSFADWVMNVAVTRAISVAESYAHRLYRAAVAYALAVATAGDQAIIKWVHSIVATIAADLSKAERYALAVATAGDQAIIKWVHSIVATIAADLSKAERYALAVATAGDQAIIKWVHGIEAQVEAIGKVSVGFVESEAASAIKAAESYADAQISKAIHIVDVDGLGELTKAWDDVVTDVQGAIGVIGTDLPDIGEMLKDLDIAVPVSIAGALGLVGTLERVMTRYLSECGIPNCRNLGGLGRLLQDLGSAAGLAALLAMLTEMIDNPEQAARDTVDEIGGLFTDAQHLVSDLLSI